jgi:hypothetical protein
MRGDQQPTFDKAEVKQAPFFIGQKKAFLQALRPRLLLPYSSIDLYIIE